MLEKVAGGGGGGRGALKINFRNSKRFVLSKCLRYSLYDIKMTVYGT
ncbi:MAG: hypothetical protein JWL85_800 [Candidatus Saccharibacteria bacterium]|nr:hypothetical protein [Candidatus Saccharibacteria bacterium]